MTRDLNPVFEMVVGDATDGFLVIVTMMPGGGSPQAQTFSINEVEAAQDYAASMARSRQEAAGSIRNHSQWVGATKSELRDHLVGSDRSDQSIGATARPALRAVASA